MAKILIVEDEPLIALTLEDMLDELGYEVAGTVASLEEALSFVETNAPDGALLDVNLGRDRIDPVADALARKGCPFIFSTGEGGGALPAPHASRPYVAKPFRMHELAAVLKETIPVAGRPSNVNKG